MYQRQTLFHRLADLKTKKQKNLENQKKAEKVFKKEDGKKDYILRNNQTPYVLNKQKK